MHTCPSYENTLPRHTSQRCAGQYHDKKFNTVNDKKIKLKKGGGRPYKNVQYIQSPLEHSLSNDFDVYLQSHCGICLTGVLFMCFTHSLKKHRRGGVGGGEFFSETKLNTCLWKKQKKKGKAIISRLIMSWCTFCSRSTC